MTHGKAWLSFYDTFAARHGATYCVVKYQLTIIFLTNNISKVNHRQHLQPYRQSLKNCFHLHSNFIKTDKHQLMHPDELIKDEIHRNDRKTINSRRISRIFAHKNMKCDCDDSRENRFLRCCCFDTSIVFMMSSHTSMSHDSRAPLKQTHLKRVDGWRWEESIASDSRAFIFSLFLRLTLNVLHPAAYFSRRVYLCSERCALLCRSLLCIKF